MKSYFKHLRADLPAGLVVFLVALPLCLGVGFASTDVKEITGLPNVFTGIVAGIIGGIIVGIVSGSRLGVSGPAAGLITIITTSLGALGSYEGFLLAVVIAGILQVIAGYLKLGIIGNYFPSAVIKGMLAAIGILLIMKEIPHAMGYDADFFGDESFLQKDGYNTFTEPFHAFKYMRPGSIIVSIISLLILILLEQKRIKSLPIFKLIPGALIVVLAGILLNTFFGSFLPHLLISEKHLVQLPATQSINEFLSLFSQPDFSFLTNIKVYQIAGTIALVASLETLLSVEATDKLDPERKITPTNRELKAQGIGNIVAGMIGGLPITQVIVRSSANINSGAKSKLSTIIHGILLLLCVYFIPSILNMIPQASLAAILIMIGYKLAKISLFKSQFSAGWDQFLPFIATIIGVMLTDLLWGIGIGLAVAIFFILRRNFRNNYRLKQTSENGKEITLITLSEEVTFLNKAGIMKQFEVLNDNAHLIIDGQKCHEIDFDVLEAIHEFKNYTSADRNITVELKNIPASK